MFAKKLLSFVSLFLIGCQFSLADTIPECEGSYSTTCIGEATVAAVCIKDKKVYYVDNATLGSVTCSTDSVNLDGIELLSVASTSVTKLTLGSTFLADTNLALFDCTGSSCVSTVGYAYDGTDYYKITEGLSTKIVTSGISNTSCEGIIGELAKITPPGKSEEVELCLGFIDDETDVEIGVPLTASGGNYLLEGTLSGNTPFSLDATNHNAVIKVEENYFIIDKSFKTTEIQCVSEAKKIEGRYENFCSSEKCEYYTCQDGSCASSVGNSCPSTCNPVSSANSCIAGYFIVDTHNSNALITNIPGNGEVIALYSCDATSAEDPTIKCDLIENANVPTGYLYNADSTNHDNVPYISCTTGTGCTRADISNESSCTNAGVGALFKSDPSNDNYQICLDSTNNKAVELADDENTIGYFADVTTSNIFGSKQDANYKYVIVDVKGINVTLRKRTDVGSDIRFKYTDNDLKIYVRGSTRTSVCNSATTINEYELYQCAGYDDSSKNYIYKKNTSRTWD